MQREADDLSRVRRALARALDRMTGAQCPSRLAEALRYSVLGGGSRVRPRLCVAVAVAHGDPEPQLTDATAVALELLHSASLVHDDLPCFDDAAIRRGRPSLHVTFGEALAVLTGDALIIGAFEEVSSASGPPEARLAITTTLARAAGMPRGMVAGQALEAVEGAELERYHHLKTATLFEAATACGALSVGAQADEWRGLGARIGAAYQIADDILDAEGSSGSLGKEVGKDDALGRPSIVRSRGLAASRAKLKAELAAALASIPACAGDEHLRSFIKERLEAIGSREGVFPLSLARQGE